MTPTRLLYLCVTLVLLISVSLPASASASSPPQWSEPEPVPSGLSSPWFPDQYADPAGNVFVIWEALRDREDSGVTDANGSAILLARHGPDGWSEPADIYVKDIYNAARPMVVSNGAYVHVIARGLRSSVTQRSIRSLAGVYYMRAPLSSDLSNAHSWTEPVLLSRSAAYWAQIAILPDGSLITVYNELYGATAGDPEETRPALFSRRSSDGGVTWSPPIRISTSTNPVARTSLAASPDGSFLVVAWDEGYDNLTGTGEPAGIFTAVSDDGGKTWHSQQKLRGQSTVARPTSYAERGLVEQSLVLTNGTTTAIIYRSTVGDTLLYRLSMNRGQTWSDEEAIPGAIARPYTGSHHFDKLSGAFDGDGRLLLTYVGLINEQSESLSVMMTTFADGSWTVPLAVAAPAGFPEYPRISVALGNQIHLTYFVRDEQFVEQGAYELWRVAGVSDAQPVALVTIAPVEPSTGSQQLTAPEVVHQPVEVVPHAERPPSPEPLPPNQIVHERPQAALMAPILRASVLTLVILGACCVMLGFARMVRNLRV